MDDAGGVRGLQRLGDLPGNGQRLLERDGSLPDAIGQRGTFDQLEDERLQAA